MIDRRAAGREGENAAYGFLAGRGYRILYKNFKCGRYGEIDIIAEKSGTICFIEVKSRSGGRYGTPSEAVGFLKRKKIIAVAGHFLRTIGIAERKMRFDVIEVYFDYTDAPEKKHVVKDIRHIENAFIDT